MFTDEQIDNILEFLRWREKEITEREITVARLKNDKSAKPQPSNSKEEEQNEIGKFSAEDIIFNEYTGYGELVPTDIGKVAKTKLWRASKNKAEAIYNDHKAIIALKFGTAERSSRLKTLLQCFLWSSSISARATRWPNAKDSDYVISGKSEISSRLNSFTSEDIVKAFEFYREHWSAIFPNYEIELDTSLIAEVLDRAYSEVKANSKISSELDPLESPYIKEMIQRFPVLEPDKLKKRIIVLAYNYPAAVQQELFSSYKNQRPDVIPDTGNDWKTEIPVYISDYKKHIETQSCEAWKLTESAQLEFEKKRKELSKKK